MKKILCLLFVLGLFFHCDQVVGQDPPPPPPPGAIAPLMPVYGLPLVIPGGAMVPVPAPGSQIGNPAAVVPADGGPIVLTNRGRVVSPPVLPDGLEIDVGIHLPTYEVIQGANYRDYVEIVLGADVTQVQQARPWGFAAPAAWVVRVEQHIVRILRFDAQGMEVQMATLPIVTNNGQWPVLVDVTLNETGEVLTVGIDVVGDSNTRQEMTVVAPPGQGVMPGPVLIFNRETVAGVTFTATITGLEIEGLGG